MHKLGTAWKRARFNLVDDWKSIRGFAVSTNVNGTVNLFARDNVPLYIKYFVSDTALGYFKLASSLINLVMLPIEPFIWPTYTEITSTIAQRQWQATRKLLRQVSTIGRRMDSVRRWRIGRFGVVVYPVCIRPRFSASLCLCSRSAYRLCFCQCAELEPAIVARARISKLPVDGCRAHWGDRDRLHFRICSARRISDRRGDLLRLSRDLHQYQCLARALHHKT